MVFAMKATVDRQTLGYLLHRVATRRQPLDLPNMIAVRVRCLWRRFSYCTDILLCFHPRMRSITSDAPTLCLNDLTA
ncbi:hypothetical protein E1297_42285 [Roseibium sp. RKSG952]|nr:hypothetical protein [Roseibium sp. RKSG952]